MYFQVIEGAVSAEEIAELRAIAARSNFVDGRVSNPHNKVKNNLQMHDQAGHQQTVQIVGRALMQREDFREFAFPKRMAPPLLTRYEPGMEYGLHSDSAVIPIGQDLLRTDLSATLFLADLDSYDGGALRISMGAGSTEFRLPPGDAIVYPSNTLHQVTPVTRGARLAAITFIESFIPDHHERELLFDLNEISAEEGERMSFEGKTRLQHVRDCLRRRFSETGLGV